MTTKLKSVRMSVKPPIFRRERAALDHSFITSKRLEIPKSPLYVPQPDDFMRGLVLWLNDDGKSAATWKDMTPGGVNNGTIYGAGTPPSATPGTLGYTFDGVDDYVDTNSASLGLNSSDNITIEAWFKTSQNYTDDAMIINDYDRTNVIGWHFSTDDTNKFVVNNIRILNNYRYIYSTSLINDGIWHHAVAVIMGNGSDIDLYLDGVDQGASTLKGTVSQLYFGNGNVIIGRQSTPSERYFNGSIDGVRIYNRALSAGEINLLFQKYRGKFGI